jgi:hypothetical protein
MRDSQVFQPLSQDQRQFSPLLHLSRHVWHDGNQTGRLLKEPLFARDLDRQGLP